MNFTCCMYVRVANVSLKMNWNVLARSKSILRCELHALAYQIECYHRAEQADEIIDPDLGRGHSNLCEATFSVLTKFRPKDINLHRLHYQASTNLGLIQSNMTYLLSRNGADYHWAFPNWKECETW